MERKRAKKVNKRFSSPDKENRARARIIALHSNNLNKNIKDPVGENKQK